MSRCLETWPGVALSHWDKEHFLAGWAVPAQEVCWLWGVGWARREWVGGFWLLLCPSFELV